MTAPGARLTMMVEEILQLHKSGRLDEAERAYREHLLAAPEDADALHLLGALRHQRGDAVEGLALLQRAIALAPDNAQFQVTLGGLQMNTGDIAAARASFETALKLDPNNGPAHSLLGHLTLHGGDAEAAESRFKTARRLDQDDPLVLLGLGNVYLSRNNAERALKYLTRAADLRPNDAATQVSLGRALLVTGANAFAERALENALRLQPDLAIAKLALGEACLKLGKLTQAQRSYTELMTASGYRDSAYAGLGDVARAAHDLGAAIGHYRTALDIAPARPTVALALGWCLEQIGDPEAAVQCLRHTLSHAPRANELREPLAVLLAKAGHVAQAIEVWREALAVDPENAIARRRLVALLELAGEFDAAAIAAEPANAGAPADAELNLVRARAGLRQRDPTQVMHALAALGGAALGPDAARLVARYRGFAEDLLGHHAEAVAAWLTAQRVAAAASRRWTLDTVPHDLQTLFASARSPAADGPAPIFLIGAPGSGVERVAALLADQPDVLVLADRFSVDGRRDGLSDPELDLTQVAPTPTPTNAQRFARRYRRALERAQPRVGALAIDWMPQWHARLMLQIAAAMPQARFIGVEREPRATLLNWLAFGAPAGFAIDDLVTVAHWLRQALAHQAACAAAAAGAFCRVDATTLLANPETGGAELARFLGRSQLTPGAQFARAGLGLGGLATAFSDARADAYGVALRESFAVLQP